ncbi:MAG: sporulation protein YqfD, partial [Clostridia bacterium]|nr:sporulation protein YqfD [Clostridia bacterium]
MIDYIFGYVEIETHRIEAVSLLAQNNIRCSEIRKDNEKIVINVPLYSLRKVRKLLNENDFFFEIIKMKGIPSLFINCRTQYGMLFGITIFLAMIIFSGKYIWSFQVSGNSYISDEEIIGILDDLGCGVGTKINDIDFDKLHNRFLMECKDISWISVNMDGVIAKVEVLEVNRGKVDTEGFANIVASESGQIERITLVKGKPQVEIGDVVKKGELL